MPSRADAITIVQTPRHLIPALYGGIYQHIRRGAEVAGWTPLSALERLFAELDQLWIIAEGEHILGAFVTTFCQEDSGVRFLGVSNLSGAGAKKWATLMSDRLVAYARENDCAFVRCYGRSAWARILPNINEIGRAENGHTYFERAA